MLEVWFLRRRDDITDNLLRNPTTELLQQRRRALVGVDQGAPVRGHISSVASNRECITGRRGAFADRQRGAVRHHEGPLIFAWGSPQFL